MKKFLSFGAAIFFLLNSHGANSPLTYQELSPGIHYANHIVESVPWSVHILRIDRRRSDLKLVTTLGKQKIFGLSPLPEQLASVPANVGSAVAGINGDFFLIANQPYQGDPRGLQISNGELVSAPAKEVCFWLDGSTPHMEKVVSKFKVTWPDGKESPFGLNESRGENEVVLLTPMLGDSTRTTNGVELVLERTAGTWLPLRAQNTYSARVRTVATTNTAIASDTMVLSIGPKLLPNLPEFKPGMMLKISTQTSASKLGKSETAIGGGPALIQGGKPLLKIGTAPAPAKETVRHPRTAFGWNDRFYFFVVVDGRRKDVSIGMTFAELAAEMLALGCKEAMNLDGGGSSTIWANGKVLNQPSDNHNRSLGNALICVRKSH